jgi:hypothetical protein
VGSDTVTATYSGDGSTYAASSGSATLAVAAVPGSYALTGAATATIAAGSSSAIPLTLTPTNYTGTVTLVAASNSANVSATLSPTSVPLANGAAAQITLTIAPNASAANRAPIMPWKGGGVIVVAVLLGAPLTLRRKGTLAVMLSVTAIIGVGFLMSCGSGSKSTSTPNNAVARSYVVTVTPTGSGTVNNPAAFSVTVTVP